MKIETASLINGGAPRRRVLFSDDVARRAHGVKDASRAGIFKDAREWAGWAASLVGCQRADGEDAPQPGDGEVEVR